MPMTRLKEVELRRKEMREWRELCERSREFERNNRGVRALEVFIVYVIPLTWPVWLWLGFALTEWSRS